MGISMGGQLVMPWWPHSVFLHALLQSHAPLYCSGAQIRVTVWLVRDERWGLTLCTSLSSNPVLLHHKMPPIRVISRPLPWREKAQASIYSKKHTYLGSQCWGCLQLKFRDQPIPFHIRPDSPSGCSLPLPLTENPALKQTNTDPSL